MQNLMFDAWEIERAMRGLQLGGSHRMGRQRHELSTEASSALARLNLRIAMQLMALHSEMHSGLRKKVWTDDEERIDDVFIEFVGFVGGKIKDTRTVSLLRRDRQDNSDTDTAAILLQVRGEVKIHLLRSSKKLNASTLIASLKDFWTRSASAFYPAKNWRIESPQYCSLFTLRISPSSMSLEGPFMDMSNRIIREYARYEHHFVNVAFVAENGSQIGPWVFKNEGADFEYKMKDSLTNGAQLAGRKFKFLAFSNSSLKEGRFLFFHEPEDDTSITVESIRTWMGDFSAIRTPARYAARMGQALTATTPTVDIDDSQVKMHHPDVKRNGYTFSDGVGTVSKDLARVIWDSLRVGRRALSALPPPDVDENESNVPSAFQIRFGGAKGMVSVDARLRGKQMCVRDSMTKFNSPNCKVLEVADYASPTMARPAHLNRQVILILENLGVPNSVFLRLQRDSIKDLSLMRTDVGKLVSMAGKMSHFGNFVRLISKNDDDIHGWISNEFIQHCLDHVRNFLLKEIKYRARIKIPNGWTLFGILDETGILKEGQVFVNVVGVLDSKDSGPPQRILKGQVVVYRNPCVHPGDIQFATAVDVPQLHHLRNVIVFSQHGNRDLPSQLAGGDLDGDQFSVFENRSLFPTAVCIPAAYTARPEKIHPHAVTINDVIAFIIYFLKNNNLGVLSKRHMAVADSAPGGPRNPGCIHLAELCSIAVDFAKSGIPAVVTSETPSFKQKPDFMRPANESSNYNRYYNSDKVMGHMFRDPELNSAIHNAEFSVAQPSNRIQRRDPLWDFILESAPEDWKDSIPLARELHASYIWQVYEITSYCDPVLSEMDLWTGCIDMSHRAYYRTHFNFDAWAKDQYGALMMRMQKQMMRDADDESVRKLAAACYHVAMQEKKPASETGDDGLAGTGGVFGFILFHHLL
ncbi:hypothetical protein CcCBS67573_g09376 [Chytriomyces confervae]|uniref:RNA-dependent RNA polymerase n=1 Tax=Chytriomyces confervae TaxID=246404 RepID=A0A507DWP2_9FUNG|nr:hypothetical protein HDU80_004937 [Chytriomyces hyalinus]TPX56199.1 hypothetical protein CcCBS67573_g09376 [Chytriomyces confervae]